LKPAIAAAVLVLLAAVAGCHAQVVHPEHEKPNRTTTAPASPTPRLPRPTPPPARRQRPVLTPVTGDHLAYAALDLRTGARTEQGAGSYDTASIVKADILAALLLRGPLTPAEQAEATPMIENSDNNAATALWNDLGGRAGLDAANKRLGLVHTRAGFGQYWGLTQTTAGDQLTLLRLIYDFESPLGAPAQEYIQHLMSHTEADQRWGVTAAGAYMGIKNGWLQRSATGLWDINSIGRVEVRGHEVLVAVLSSGNTSEAEGISLVQSEARKAVEGL